MSKTPREATPPATSTGEREIPAGMKPWHGGDSAPEDWDGGPGVYFRNGRVSAERRGWNWTHVGTGSDIIAYTPRADAILAQPSRTGEVERLALGVADTIEEHMKSSAMIWSLGKDLPDDWMTELRSITVAALEGALAQQPTAPDEAVRAAKDKRRSALIERIGTIADLACEKPLQGELGDVAYDLLRQAAAQISSDRKALAALSHATSAGER